MLVLVRHLAAADTESVGHEVAHEATAPGDPSAGEDASACDDIPRGSQDTAVRLGTLEVAPLGEAITRNGEGATRTEWGPVPDCDGESVVDIDDGFALPPPAIDVDEPIDAFPPVLHTDLDIGSSDVLSTALATVLSGRGQSLGSSTPRTETSYGFDVEDLHTDVGVEVPWSVTPAHMTFGSARTDSVGTTAIYGSSPDPAGGIEGVDVRGVVSERQHNDKLLALVVELWARNVAEFRHRNDELPPPPQFGFRQTSPQEGLRQNSKSTSPTQARKVQKSPQPRPGVGMPRTPLAVGCCQAVRVGRRRVAVRRAPRQLVGGPLISHGLGGLGGGLGSGLGGGHLAAGLSGGLRGISGRFMREEWGYALRREPRRSRPKPSSATVLLSPPMERASSPVKT